MIIQALQLLGKGKLVPKVRALDYKFAPSLETILQDNPYSIAI
jgi:hypothetical protein